MIDLLGLPCVVGRRFVGIVPSDCLRIEVPALAGAPGGTASAEYRLGLDDGDIAGSFDCHDAKRLAGMLSVYALAFGTAEKHQSSTSSAPKYSS
jgi:hypothetical protein